MHIVDGTNMIFGRMASQIAKRLMRGEEVHLVNAEKIIIIGSPEKIAQRYLTKRGLRNKGTPERSPVWAKIPHLFVKRLVRGMLPRETSRGKAALTKLRVYTGNPKKMEANLKLENASFDGFSKHITIHQICRSIGYTG
ncbi:MAG: 50S ribosomal protein L13 [Candidatus Micrarchaeota archaeon]